MTIPNISTEVQYTSTGGNGSIVFRFFLFKTFAIFLMDYKLVWKLSWLDLTTILSKIRRLGES